MNDQAGTMTSKKLFRLCQYTLHDVHFAKSADPVHVVRTHFILYDAKVKRCTNPVIHNINFALTTLTFLRVCMVLDDKNVAPI